MLADKGYTRAGRHVHKGRYKPASQQAANLAHAKLRTPGAGQRQPQIWDIRRKLRCCA